MIKVPFQFFVSPFDKENKIGKKISLFVDPRELFAYACANKEPMLFFYNTMHRNNRQNKHNSVQRITGKKSGPIKNGKSPINYSKQRASNQTAVDFSSSSASSRVMQLMMRPMHGPGYLRPDDKSLGQVISLNDPKPPIEKTTLSYAPPLIAGHRSRRTGKQGGEKQWTGLTGRIPHFINNYRSNVVHTFTQVVQVSSYLQTTSFTNAGYAFTFGQLAQASTIGAFFDQYKINRIECSFTPRYTTGITGSNSPLLYTIIDYDDAVVSGYTAATYMQYENCMIDRKSVV